MRILLACISTLFILGCSNVIETTRTEEKVPSKAKIEPTKTQISALELLAMSEPPPPISISPKDRARLLQREKDEQVAWHKDYEIISSDEYAVTMIKQAVLADTVHPDTVEFCQKFEKTINKRGNRVFVGWYSSKNLDGRKRGTDNIIAEVNGTRPTVS